MTRNLSVMNGEWYNRNMSVPYFQDHNWFGRMWNANWFPFVLLGVCCLVNYWPTLHSGFKLDDFTYLSADLRPTYTSLADLFIRSDNQHYNPINVLLNDTLFKWWGRQVVFYHVLNIILFFLNCYFLFRISLLLTQHRNVSLLSAILFCLHPINAEIVNQIVFNTVLLSALCFQASFVLYDQFVQTSRRKPFYFSLVLALIAFLTLETSWLLPMYLFVWTLLYRRWSFQKAVLTILPFIILTLILFLIWNLVSQGNSLSNDLPYKFAYLNLTLLNFVGTLVLLAAWYLTKLFIPYNVIWIYGLDPIAPALARLCISTLIILLAFVIVFRKKIFLTYAHSVAALWFLMGAVFLIPGSLVHPDVGLIIEPYWFYISSMGFFIFMALFFRELKKILPRWFFTCMVILCGFSLFLLSQRINTVAKTEKSYSAYWLGISLNPVPLTAVAKIAMSEHQYRKALQYYQMYFEKFSFSPYSVFPPSLLYTTMASAHLQLGEIDKAKALIDRSIATNQKDARAYILLGSIYATEKRYTQAEEAFLKAIELNPETQLSRVNLADLYLLTQKGPQALAVLEKVKVDLLRGSDKINVQAKLVVLQFLHKSPQVAMVTMEALFKSNNIPDVYFILAQAFEEAKVFDIAELILDQGLKQHPQSQKLYLLSGIIWANQGKLSQAIEIWQRGLQHCPEDGDLLENIAKAKYLMHQQSNSATIK